MYELITMSKWQIEEYSRGHIEDNCIIISINDTHYDTDIKDNSKIVDILKLTFDDITDTYIKRCKASRIACSLRLMTVEDVMKIKKFIDKYKDIVKTIVIHCTAGVSRSGAVSLALYKYLNNDDTPLWESNKYIPNKFVYKLMCEGLGLTYSEEEFNQHMNKYLSINTYFDSAKQYTLADLLKE